MRRRWLSLYAWTIYALLYLPILVLIVLSFNESRHSTVWKGITLQWYVKLVQNGLLWQAAWNSLLIATASALLATVLGTLTALALARHRIPGRVGVQGLLYLPLVLPDILLGVGALVLFALLGIRLGLGTVLASHVGLCVAYVVMVLQARLAVIDQSLEEAAADLGATPWQTFRHITLPLLAPGILAGALLAFTISLDDFMLAYFTAGPGSTTLPLRIYGMVKVGITPEVNALSTVLLVLTGLAAWLFQRLTGDQANQASDR